MNKENMFSIKNNSYWFYSKPSYFFKTTRYMTGTILLASIICLLIGVIVGTVCLESDIQQGENYKIIYLHVPSAWMSILLYTHLCVLSILYLIWLHPMSLFLAKISSVLGTFYTIVTLITGSLWGLPVWGTFWVWDARLTSVLILFFLYLSYILFLYSFGNSTQGAKVASILSIVGFINIPVIKYSVEWWNTLHQPSSISQVNSSIDISILIPLIIIFIGFLLLSLYISLVLLRRDILKRKCTNYTKYN